MGTSLPGNSTGKERYWAPGTLSIRVKGYTPKDQHLLHSFPPLQGGDYDPFFKKGDKFHLCMFQTMSPTKPQDRKA